VTRWADSDGPVGAEYDDRFERLARAGRDVHGEASFVAGYEPGTVLDAGCGTGRVAIELARRGIRTDGVDLDRRMLERAQAKSDEVSWYLADLADFELARPDGTPARYHVVVAAGNVMIFLQPGTEGRVVERLAAHLVPGGLLVSGFQLLPGRHTLEDYEADAAAAGLVPYERFASWSRDPWTAEAGYVVAVHRRLPESEDPEPPEARPRARRR
jgi:SAM-dependent methyltransferase